MNAVISKVLFIGPTIRADDESLGGTTISFEMLLTHVRERAQPHSIISVNRIRHRWISAILVILQMIWKVPLNDVVMLNANPRGALILAPMVSLYSRLWRKYFVFRMFGGDLIEIYERSSPKTQRRMNKTIFAADIVYLQTKRLIEHFKDHSDKIKWLPTSRVMQPKEKNIKVFKGRFVYIGQIIPNKGIDLLLQLAKNRTDITVTIYGPILDPQYENIKKEHCYHGVLAPKDVSNALSKYDVLLLPTFHPGEGYPGIIIEAFSEGLPVISTEWLAIPCLLYTSPSPRDRG